MKALKVIAVIPARYGATRFPGKPLARIAGRPMIQWVAENTRRVRELSDVLVATDDSRIFRAVRAFGGKAVMTPKNMRTGSDRVARAVRGRRAEWVLNVQGDEPLVEPAVLRKLIRAARGVSGPCIITAAGRIRSPREYRDPNAVKVVTDRQGRALYFSRAPIPDVSRFPGFPRQRLLRHIGIYLFHRRALARFAALPQAFLEKAEQLEQLRALAGGIPIQVVPADYCPIHVDAPGDIARVEKVFCARGKVGHVHQT